MTAVIATQQLTPTTRVRVLRQKRQRLILHEPLRRVGARYAWCIVGASCVSVRERAP